MYGALSSGMGREVTGHLGCLAFRATCTQNNPKIVTLAQDETPVSVYQGAPGHQRFWDNYLACKWYSAKCLHRKAGHGYQRRVPGRPSSCSSDVGRSWEKWDRNNLYETLEGMNKKTKYLRRKLKRKMVQRPKGKAGPGAR